MNSIKPIILLVGKSGSGKNAIAHSLRDRYNMNIVQSYTTRLPRYENEDDHIFITKDELSQYPIEEIAAYTYYNDNHYFATKDQLDNNEIYIVDIDGVLSLLECYPEKNYLIFYIDVDEQTRKMRMLERGDSLDKVEERLKNDIVFDEIHNINIDYITINNNNIMSINTAADLIFSHYTTEYMAWNS